MKVCKVCSRCFESDLSKCPIDSASLREFFPGPPVIDSKYRLEYCLGEGGMGTVFCALHPALNRRFALKVISRLENRPDMVARFKREASALGRLKHPCIVQVTDFGLDPRGIFYLVMEYLEGQTLSAFLRAKKGAISAEEALSILSEIASGLDYAHQQGILHRDLKAGNVILAQDPAGNRVAKILDFGLAKFVEVSGQMEGQPVPTELQRNDEAQTELQRDSVETISVGPEEGPPLVSGPQPTPSLDEEMTRGVSAVHDETIHFAPGTQERNVRESTNKLVVSQHEVDWLTSHGTVMGTTGTMPPEQIRGETVSPLSDVYAFGVLAYQLFTGSVPFRGETKEVWRRQMEEDPPHPTVLRPEVPRELGDVLLKPLARDPQHRPSSAAEVVRLLKTAHAAAEFRSWRAREWPRRWNISAALSLMVALLYLLAAGQWPLQWLEAQVAGLWFTLAPQQNPDPRIVIVSIDEASLQADPLSLVERADQTGEVVSALFDNGAGGVAVDLLLPERWNNSEKFIDAVVNHPDHIALSALSTEENTVIGPEVAGGLITVALGQKNVSQLFGFVNVKVDPDGVVRTLRMAYTDKSGTPQDTLAGRAARLLAPAGPVADGHAYWIDYRIDWNKYQRISWKDIKSVLATHPAAFKRKLALIGAEYEGSGDEDHQIPSFVGTSTTVSGLVLNAMMIDTILKGNPFRSPGSKVPFAAGLLPLLALIIMGVLYRSRVVPVFASAAGVCVLLFLSASLFFSHGWILPVAGPCAFLVLASIAGWLIRRRLPERPTPD